jgi:hypothetical protein
MCPVVYVSCSTAVHVSSGTAETQYVFLDALGQLVLYWPSVMCFISCMCPHTRTNYRDSSQSPYITATYLSACTCIYVYM